MSIFAADEKLDKVKTRHILDAKLEKSMMTMPQKEIRRRPQRASNRIDSYTMVL
jgi:hypothetical protein